jgi:hypothetical protein
LVQKHISFNCSDLEIRGVLFLFWNIDGAKFLCWYALYLRSCLYFWKKGLPDWGLEV